MNRNYIYNLCISLINILFPIVTFRYSAQLLGPVGIGKVQFAISFAEYFALFAALGIPIYGIAATARSNGGTAKLSRVFSELISLHALSGLLFSAAYFLIIYNVPFFKPDISLHAAAGLIILLGFTSIDWFYFGIEKFKLIALRSVSIKLLAVAFLFIFVKTPTDYLNYLWVLLFTILGNNLISLAFITRHTRISFKGLGIKKHFKPVLFILGSNIAINMYALWDTLILAFLTDDRTVGLYAAAIKLIKFSVPFIIALGASLIPKLTQSIHNKDHAGTTDLLSQTFHFVAFMAVPISVGLYLLAPEFIEVLSGKEFLPVIGVMRILSVLPILIGLGHFFSLQIMVPAGLNKQMFYATLVAAVCSVGLNLTLIPLLNITGAGIANIIAELIVTSLFYYFVVKNFQVKIKWMLMVKALVCAALFIPLIHVIKNIFDNAWIILFTSAAVCSFIYTALQLFIFKDALVKDILAKIGARLAMRKATL